jgi:lysozyme
VTVSGIDISSWQGPAFDWNSYQGKIGFGMAKAAEGTAETDPDFARNWGCMWDMNAAHTFPRFAYLFFHAGQNPEDQGAHLVATVKAQGLYPGDNFVLDIESTDGDLNDGLTAAQCAPLAVRCMQAVNTLAPGHRVLPYMNGAWAQTGGSTGMAAWYLWLASYGVSEPAVPPPWETWTFWQTGDDPVDTDVFNGDEAQLLAFCRMPAKR